MYEIKKQIFIFQRPLWMLDLLLRIEPSLYGAFYSRQEAINAINKIYNIAINGTYRWHRGSISLKHFLILSVTDKTFEIFNQKNKIILKFKIYEYTKK